jgi:hypothetical protein
MGSVWGIDGLSLVSELWESLTHHYNVAIIDIRNGSDEGL